MALTGRNIDEEAQPTQPLSQGALKLTEALANIRRVLEMREQGSASLDAILAELADLPEAALARAQAQALRFAADKERSSLLRAASLLEALSLQERQSASLPSSQSRATLSARLRAIADEVEALGESPPFAGAPRESAGGGTEAVDSPEGRIQKQAEMLDAIDSALTELAAPAVAERARSRTGRLATGKEIVVEEAQLLAAAEKHSVTIGPQTWLCATPHALESLQHGTELARQLADQRPHRVQDLLDSDESAADDGVAWLQILVDRGQVTASER